MYLYDQNSSYVKGVVFASRIILKGKLKDTNRFEFSEPIFNLTKLDSKLNWYKLQSELGFIEYYYFDVFYPIQVMQNRNYSRLNLNNGKV